MKRLLTCLIFLSALGGCYDHDEMVKKFLPAPIDRYARDYIQKVVEKDLGAVYAPLNPELKNEKSRQALASVFDYIKGSEIISLKTTGIRTHEFNGATNYTTYTISYQIEFPNAWQVANISLMQEAGVLTVNSFNLNDIPKSLPEMNGYNFSEKGAYHYLFLAIAIAYVLFILYAFISCLRTQNLRRKWLWAIITILGVIEVSFNWTTGQYSIQPIKLGFAVSGFYSPGAYLPIILNFYLPLGGILFLWKRNALSKPTTFRETVLGEEETVHFPPEGPELRG